MKVLSGRWGDVFVVEGYRPLEVGVKPHIDVDSSFNIIKKPEIDYISDRKPVLTMIGPMLIGASSPFPDVFDQSSALLGVAKRIACKMPGIDPTLYGEFYHFSKKIIKIEFQNCILTPELDCSVETWLLNCPYTQPRKNSLLRTSEFGLPRSQHMKVKCFVKREFYSLYKHYRGIYSRTDQFKVFVGPYIALIGKMMFQHQSFIKYVSMELRAEVLYDKYSVPNLKVSSNDFSTFEATFVVLLMKIELYFFAWVLRFRPERFLIFAYLFIIKTGRNYLVFRAFLVSLIAKRYSGEMDTSNSNGLFNFLLVMFMSYKSGEFSFTKTGYDRPMLYPTIEGDDSLIPHFKNLDHSILLRLGAVAKLETFNNAFEASFCGMIFNPDNFQMITDPIRIITKFGFASDRYLTANFKTKRALVRAKSLSLLYTYPNCPIITVMCKRYVYLTRFVAIKELTKALKSLEWQATVLPDLSVKWWLKPHCIELTTRLLMESKFNIPVDLQFYLEEFYEQINNLNPYQCPALLEYVNNDQINFYNNYIYQI